MFIEHFTEILLDPVFFLRSHTVLDTYNVHYRAETSHDVWQFAIVVFVCLTGCLPWQKAALDDPRYSRYLQWHCRNNVLIPTRRPKLFKLLTAKAQRCLRKFLEPRVEKRPQRLTDLSRYTEDRWVAKSSSDRQNGKTYFFIINNEELNYCNWPVDSIGNLVKGVPLFVVHAHTHTNWLF